MQRFALREPFTVGILFSPGRLCGEKGCFRVKKSNFPRIMRSVGFVLVNDISELSKAYQRVMVQSSKRDASPQQRTYQCNRLCDYNLQCECIKIPASFREPRLNFWIFFQNSVFSNMAH